jgi:hypothetical protein
MRHDDQLERYRIPVDEYLRRSLENLDEYATSGGRSIRAPHIPIERQGEPATSTSHAAPSRARVTFRSLSARFITRRGRRAPNATNRSGAAAVAPGIRVTGRVAPMLRHESRA